MDKNLCVALLGGGTIARLVLQQMRRGNMPALSLVGIAGRSTQSKAQVLAREFEVPFGVGRQALLEWRPDIVLEAASHEAVRDHLVPLLDAGIGVIVLSAGALADDSLRESAERASARTGALLYVPSGGIAGLDALKTACLAGVDEVTIKVAKPPAAWKGIAYVQARGFDLNGLQAPLTLFAGPAREGVPHFPQNVNIAAVLSMAGIGFDRTRLEVVADPALELNTHTIRVSGNCGRMTIVLENVPAPENPKTSWLACYSALAALGALASRQRYGT
ncbi:MAG: aspartate dehydrogenase [Actinobacteria bacterium]|nr:aspartate dehydrogenase [Actinomycetota bacterium]